MRRDVSVQARLNESRLEYVMCSLPMHRDAAGFLPRWEQRTARLSVLVLLTCHSMRLSIARLPSIFTGTALEISPPLTMDLSKSRSVTADPFCQTSPICRLKSSLIRPPVLTPSMKSPLLRTEKVPVKHVDTLRISSLSRGLVPFIISSQRSAIGCLRSFLIP